VPRNEIPWRWTKQRELAARLCAEDLLPDRKIADQVGISDQCLYNWRAKPEFADRVQSLTAAYRERIRTTSIAVVENRVARMLRELEDLDAVEVERARVYGAERFKDAIPGGGTGKVVITRYRKITVVDGVGRKVEQNVPITKADTDIVNAKLAILKQAAQDLGQWAEKSDPAGTDRLNELIEIARMGPVEKKPAEDTPKS
jgi:hypothetical protein